MSSEKITCSRCGKQNLSKKNISTHYKKGCNKKNLKDLKNETNINKEKSDISIQTFMNIIAQQQKQISELMDQQKEMNELVKTLKDTTLTQPAQNIVYDFSQNIVNVQFNIHNYLNETCSQAKNFEDSIPNKIDDDLLLEFDGTKTQNGKQLISTLNEFWKNIPQIERPIQTTDLRRNIFWFKTNNEWFKYIEKTSTSIKFKKLLRDEFRTKFLKSYLNKSNKNIIKINLNEEVDDTKYNIDYRLTDVMLCINVIDDLFLDKLHEILKFNKIEKKYNNEE